MLIKALNDYYDIMVEKGKTIEDGFSKIGIHYLISLSPDGKITDIINYQEEREIEGAKKSKIVLEARDEIFPKRTEKPGIESNIIEHRPLYIFGLNFVSGILEAEDKTNKAKKSHEAFITKNLEFIEEMDSPIINAYRNFMTNYNPLEECENQLILSLGKMYATSRFAFCLEGQPNVLLHKDPQITNKWRESCNNNSSEEGFFAQCAITGEYSEIPRLHNKVKGINAMGSVLIGYNNPSESSYNNVQARNSNISEKVMNRYVSALNYLLEGREHKTYIDDIIVVYFAMSKSDKYDEIVADCIFGNVSEKSDADSTERFLQDLMKESKEGNISASRIDVLDGIDENVDFYIVGMKPNSSRLAIKFVNKRKFGDLLQNIATHQNDLKLTEESKTIPLWQLKSELKSPTSKSDEINPALIAKLMSAIMNGDNYPEALLSTIIRRVKYDSDGEAKKDKNRKINGRRISILKACINRKQRKQGKEEEITMALNEENKDRAYLCGRLFALLEKLQQDASGGGLNRTIKDGYFASACSTPALVFPKLLRLAQNHLNKAKYAKSTNWEMGQVISLLENEFPKQLSLEEQGKFIVGYYQQFYKKYNVKETEEDN